jgi:glutathione peroxidase
MSLYTLTAASLDATPADLATHKGKVTLVVNVASACGLTPQYTAPQQLHAVLFQLAQP